MEQVFIGASCAGCGYDLRGQSAGAERCPECGIALELSRIVPTPAQLGNDWLVRFRGGVQSLLRVHLFMIVALLVSLANDQLHFTHVPFFLLIMASVCIMSAVAMWMITPPTPALEIDRWWRWVRRTMRVFSIPAILAAALVWVHYARPISPRVQSWMPLMLMCGIWLMCSALTYAYLSAICDRLRARLLADLSRLTMWLMPMALIVVAFGVLLLARMLAPSLQLRFRLAITSASFLLTLCPYLLALGILARLSTRLKLTLSDSNSCSSV